MCGINGFTFKNPHLIKEMMRVTSHRGPDGSGFYCDENISIGHNLLAITETPEHSKQPVVSADKTIVLSYNGEIYNYLELKKSLQSQGIAFHTESDTEVLMKGIEAEGIEFLYKLNGMFAIALYNKRTRKLILARDPSGIKPLYYCREGGKFIFSSEIKGILSHPVSAKLDMQSLSIFLDIGYVPGHKTLIKKILKVCPGEILFINIQNGNELGKRWLLGNNKEVPIEKIDLVEIRDKIKASVNSHLMGRRPVGVYLSGGLDSSILLYEIHSLNKNEVQSFTTRFEGEWDYHNEDADVAKEMARNFGIRHNELVITEENFIGSIGKVIDAVEEPRHNNSLAAYYLLAQEASSEVVVTLSGEGGDELFGGYPKYYHSSKMTSNYSRYPKTLVEFYYSLKNCVRRKNDFFPWVKLNDPVARWVHLISHMPKSFRSLFRFPKNCSDVTNYLHSWTSHLYERFSDDMENTMMYLDRYFWLADEAYPRSDKIGMHFGMEARFPFADKPLVDFANRIPSRYKLNGSVQMPKTILRNAYRGKIPDIVLDKQKTGWRAPTGHWMSSRLGPLVREIFTKDYYPETADLFNFEAITQLAKNDPYIFAKREFYSIFSFQIWAKKFNIKL